MRRKAVALAWVAVLVSATAASAGTLRVVSGVPPCPAAAAGPAPQDVHVSGLRPQAPVGTQSWFSVHATGGGGAATAGGVTVVITGTYTTSGGTGALSWVGEGAQVQTLSDRGIPGPILPVGSYTAFITVAGSVDHPDASAPQYCVGVYESETVTRGIQITGTPTQAKHQQINRQQVKNDVRVALADIANTQSDTSSLESDASSVSQTVAGSVTQDAQLADHNAALATSKENFAITMITSKGGSHGENAAAGDIAKALGEAATTQEAFAAALTMMKNRGGSQDGSAIHDAKQGEAAGKGTIAALLRALKALSG